MKIIITGASGFIGTNLVKLLEKSPEKYTLTKLSRNDGDITSPGILDSFEADCVVHLAAILKGPEKEMMDVNVKGTLNVLEYCRKKGAKLIFASSAAVYGISKSPLNEESNPAPISFYGLTKFLGETICEYYRKRLDTRVNILRFFNVYGKNQPEGLFIPDLLKKLGNNKIILRNPYPKRDFTYVDDVVNAIVKSIDAEESHTLNIGSGKSYSVKEVAEKLTDKPIEFEDLSVLENNSQADITKAKNLLGWEPKISLEKGLAKLLA